MIVWSSGRGGCPIGLADPGLPSAYAHRLEPLNSGMMIELLFPRRQIGASDGVRVIQPHPACHRALPQGRLKMTRYGNAWSSSGVTATPASRKRCSKRCHSCSSPVSSASSGKTTL